MGERRNPGFDDKRDDRVRKLAADISALLADANLGEAIAACQSAMMQGVITSAPDISAFDKAADAVGCSWDLSVAAMRKLLKDSAP